MKDNHEEIQVEQPRSSKITITAPKGYTKVQAMVQENEKKIDLDIKQYEDIEDDDKIQNGSQTVPPKPLPRASRANSISEEDPKPVARPRTSPNPSSVVTPVNPNAVGGYKVSDRLKKCVGIIIQKIVFSYRKKM